MNKKSIAIIDYGIGNVKSIANAVLKIGANAVVTSDKEIILAADALILPGVGAFATGMQNLIDNNLIPVIHEFVSTKKPFIGICLGMQMLMDESEEFGLTRGLGFISGKVIKMPIQVGCVEKLPHVSWNELLEPEEGRWAGTILNELQPKENVYFVHSFVAVPVNHKDCLAVTEYGGSHFCAAIQKDNIYGVQFHPEKSGTKGLKILSNFINI